ncbi:hypothetical protein B0H63DRAFT_90460 [Podospora didyma]|uniref:Uncharacterized protein n=1 Tax=Podospora didyma TaxID=330526 RepID=A0AAE0JYR2_9PEZI|nr:hypothetical protein B0H63DRAFT_90460 [Podospora didyma]
MWHVPAWMALTEDSLLQLSSLLNRLSPPPPPLPSPPLLYPLVGLGSSCRPSFRIFGPFPAGLLSNLFTTPISSCSLTFARKTRPAAVDQTWCAAASLRRRPITSSQSPREATFRTSRAHKDPIGGLNARELELILLPTQIFCLPTPKTIRRQLSPSSHRGTPALPLASTSSVAQPLDASDEMTISRTTCRSAGAAMSTASRSAFFLPLFFSMVSCHICCTIQLARYQCRRSSRHCRTH